MFLGRKEEIGVLRESNWRDRAKLIAIHGRRRVGKTALVNEAYMNEILWKFEGIEQADESMQIQVFFQRLQEYTGQDLAVVKDWNGAFLALDKALAGKSVVVFFDEFQWLVCMNSKQVSLFKYYWDNYFQKHKKCTFVICGSVSSFMVRKVVRSKALYGRVDAEIALKPLNLKDIKGLLPWAAPQDILEYAMTFGGVPEYLLALNPSSSYIQNIDTRAFSSSGYFLGEFNRLFISHFSSNPQYQNVILSLGDGSKNAEGLAKHCHVSTGGAFTQVLDDLSLAGFIEKYQPIDKPINSKQIKYRLIDEYLNFYFDFIHANVPAILKGEFKFNHIVSQKLSQWQGYAFERLCRKQAAIIADILRFSAVSYVSGSWFRSRTIHDKSFTAGAQIDLMFLRKDRVITVCEAKYTSRLQAQSLIKDMQQKTEVLRAYFPQYAVQRILILGKKMEPPNSVTQAFDRILFAEDFI
ncbi:MAG: hypothetical protein ACD_62C00095G0002 [uncultured bacterium]|nr:MAG: hypothetical protein ACD_62C00095G0002 [uncultured bacterium]